MRRLGLTAVALLVTVVPAQAQEIGWAAGLLATINVQGPQQTDDLIDANGIVQTTRIESTKVRPAIETHVLAGWTHVKLGPFVGVELGDAIISSVGAGIVIEVLGMPIGIGYWVNPNGRVRRSDFVPGQMAPAGYTEVQYVERAVTSLALLAAISLPGSR